MSNGIFTRGIARTVKTNWTRTMKSTCTANGCFLRLYRLLWWIPWFSYLRFQILAIQNHNSSSIAHYTLQIVQSSNERLQLLLGQLLKVLLHGLSLNQSTEVLGEMFCLQRNLVSKVSKISYKFINIILYIFLRIL